MSTQMTDERARDWSPVPWRDRWIVAAWSVVLSVVIFAPLLGSRGGVLRGDLFFVPQQPIKGTWLGLTDSAPHTAPYDFLISIVTSVVPGDILQKALLLAVLIIAGTGAAAAVARYGLPAQLVAATFFVWNPYVYERLYTGSLQLLFGYAALGWVAWAATRRDAHTWRGLGPMIIALAIAGWASPTGGLIALVVALCAVAHRGIRPLLLTLGAGILVNLPSILPALFRPGGVLPDSTGVDAYSASPDTSLGVLGSLLTLGGVWDPDAVAPWRDNGIVVAIALIVTILGLIGVGLAWSRAPRGPLTGLSVAAAIGLLIALLGAYGGTRTVIDSLAENVPGGVLLRDGHAWLAPLALLLAVGWGSLAYHLAYRGSTAIMAATTVIGIAVPIALLPGLALAMDGELENDRFPGEWWHVRGLLEGKDPAGIAVLPLGGYRDFSWASSSQVADPAARYFFGDVVIDDTRTVNGAVVASNSDRAGKLSAAVDEPRGLTDALLAMGIDTVIIERGQEGAEPRLTGNNVDRTFRGKQLAVWEISGDVGDDGDKPPAIPIILGDVIAALLVLLAIAMAAGALGRTRPVGGLPPSAEDQQRAFGRPGPAPVPPAYSTLPPPPPPPTEMIAPGETEPEVVIPAAGDTAVISTTQTEFVDVVPGEDETTVVHTTAETSAITVPAGDTADTGDTGGTADATDDTQAVQPVEPVESVEPADTVDTDDSTAATNTGTDSDPGDDTRRF
jgi:hypothetical protein